MKTSNNTENFALKAKSPKNRIYFLRAFQSLCIDDRDGKIQDCY